MTLIVNGEKIEDSHIQEEVERLRPHYERVFIEQTPEKQQKRLFEWSKENVIERVLINQHAKESPCKISEEEIESAFENLKNQSLNNAQLKEELNDNGEKNIKSQIEQQLKVERLLAEISKDVTEPSEKEISQFYETNREQFRTPEGVRVAHIVKHINGITDESVAHNIIQQAKEKLDKGAIFETLVSKFSDCTENNGDLGYITRGQMVEEFEDVVFNLSPNQLSDVFRTRFGFHIAKVYDRKPASFFSLEETKEQIINELKGQKKKDAIDNFVDELKTKAKIEEN